MARKNEKCRYCGRSADPKNEYPNAEVVHMECAVAHNQRVMQRDYVCPLCGEEYQAIVGNECPHCGRKVAGLRA